MSLGPPPKGPEAPAAEAAGRPVRAGTPRRAPALDAGLSLAAVLGIAVVAYALVARHPVRWDLTKGHRYALSEETLAALRGLTAGLDVFAFFKEGDEARIAMKDLLEEYATASPRFRYRFVDPDRSPGLAKHHGVRSYGTTVVSSGDRETTLFTASEAQMTAAILRVTREDSRRVAVLSGHGERSMADEGQEGYSAARDALARMRIEAREVALLRGGDDLAAYDALLIAGPRRDLVLDERAAIEAFLDVGGALVVLVDPGEFPEIDGLLAHEGLALGREIVVDRLSKAFGADILVPVVTDYPETEITRDFRLSTLYPLARPVLLTSTVPPGSERSPVASAGPESWGESDTRLLLSERKAALDPKADRVGALSIAAMAERPAGKGRARVVLFGDSDFADNAYFAVAVNGDIFQNAVSWAVGEKRPALIRPRERSSEPLVLSSRQGALFFWVPLVVVPGVALLAGIGVLARRR